MNDTNKPLNIPGVKISPATEGCLLGIPVDPWNATVYGSMLYALLKRIEKLEAIEALKAKRAVKKEDLSVTVSRFDDLTKIFVELYASVIRDIPNKEIDAANTNLVEQAKAEMIEQLLEKFNGPRVVAEAARASDAG